MKEKEKEKEANKPKFRAQVYIAQNLLPAHSFTSYSRFTAYSRSIRIFIHSLLAHPFLLYCTSIHSLLALILFIINSQTKRLNPKKDLKEDNIYLYCMYLLSFFFLDSF